MWHVYILYSIKAAKTYTGFSNDVQRRLFEHNISESRGFTLRYRPWTLIRTENFSTKKDAMLREKFLKTGRGREQVKNFIQNFIHNAAVSAAAEKD
ncbi:MAG: GIY-YIG nuclease family protein [Chitinophagaceae bacterium]|nr:GIY-YIG nuclease family protein [Chitinophagaceae bacterium]